MCKQQIEECLTIGPPRGLLRDVEGTWHWHFFRCTADYWIYAARPELRLVFHDSTRSVQYIPLSRTKPNYGGIRWWFLCPKCGRRVAQLHKPSTAQHFWCRYCHDLTYESAQSSGTKKWKRFQLAGKKADIATREVAQWYRLKHGPIYVHEVKRPLLNKIRDRRTGFALSVTKEARRQNLTL